MRARLESSLLHRLRCGELTAQRVRAAARCGHAEALRLFPGEAVLPPTDLPGLALLDAREARLFAADCAEAVLPIFEAAQPADYRPRLTIDAARRFANGQLSEGEMLDWRVAARTAAAQAAWSGAGAAARAAAWSAVWCSAQEDVGHCASRAAPAAARAAARSVSWSASRAAAARCADACADARARAGSAARDAAWLSARKSQRSRLALYLVKEAEGA